MILPQPRSTRTATPVPYTTLFLSCVAPLRVPATIGRLRRRPPRPPPCADGAVVAVAAGWYRAFGGRGGRVILVPAGARRERSEEHTSELQSLMRISYAAFCLKKKRIYTTMIHILVANYYESTSDNNYYFVPE